MELYYKDLISEDASLEKLVDKMTLVVQGADEFAEVAGNEVEGEQKEQLMSRLERLKAACQRVKEQAFVGARAADKTMRQYPYSSIGLAFSCGLLAGALASKRRQAGGGAA
jgi:ElaB/YqjD/DUF883 family membrane-anchored ribosome-binding protein